MVHLQTFFYSVGKNLHIVPLKADPHALKGVSFLVLVHLGIWHAYQPKDIPVSWLLVVGHFVLASIGYPGYAS